MTEHVRQRKLLHTEPPLHAWSVSFRDSALSPIGTREDLAREMVAEVAVGDAAVRNDFDEISIFQRPIFNATWDSELGCWKDFVAKGEAGFTYSPTEENREVVYRCTPFWYRIEFTADGDPNFFSVSDSPEKGYTLAPMFRDGETYEYRPCFEMSVDENGKPHSRAGVEPLQGTALSVINTCRSFDSAARTESYADWFSDLVLLMVEFATKDLKSVMKGHAEAVPLRFALEESGLERTGLYLTVREVFDVGDSVILYYYLSGKYVSKTVQIVEIDPDYISNFGHYLGLDISEEEVYSIGNEGMYPYLCGFVKETGGALPVVTNASSGIAHKDNGAPCVWRGKENPWGNAGSLIWDIAARLAKNYCLNPCVLDDFSQFSGTLNEHYREYPTLPVQIGSSSYVTKLKGIEDIAPYYFMPSATSTRNNLGWCCRAHLDNQKQKGDDTRFLRVGGSHRTESGGSHAILQFLGQSCEDDCFGARLVMKEGLK